MNHRIQGLMDQTSGRPVRVGILSMYDVENNAVRVLAATLREAGHTVVEIYFKDWISNHLAPATDLEYANLEKTIRDRQLDLVCVSIRASAYYMSAKLNHSVLPVGPGRFIAPSNYHGGTNCLVRNSLLFYQAPIWTR